MPALQFPALAGMLLAACAGTPVDARQADAGARTSEIGGYLVVEVALEGAQDADFAAAAHEVAHRAAGFHRGRVRNWDGKDFAAWRALLHEESPEQVLFLVPPEVLDVPLHRRVLLASAELDDDPLPDFSWGWFTAGDGDALRAFWERTERVHREGLAAGPWLDVAVASGIRSTIYAGSIPATAQAAGFQGDSIYFATVDADPDNLAFVDAQLPRLEGAAVVEFTGNGDPEGIWLFPGGRNLERSKHWDYDPARVGEDPEGAMPRVTAARFAALSLQSPVVWSGTCHSAATARVWVESDIVSTFGRTACATLHLLPRERSIGLAMIDAGAVAYLAPLGANHGMAVSRERDAALTRGCTLGEAVKSTWDDVFLAAGGAPALDFPVAGEPHLRGEPVMQGGGANRVLIGDPALRPFPAVAHPLEEVEVRVVDGGIDVRVDWRAGWHPTAWDMYGSDRSADWRVVARVPLDAAAAAALRRDGRIAFEVEVEARGADGAPLPYVLRHAVLETWRGQPVLHLQANAPRSEVERAAVDTVFRIRGV